MILDNLGIFSRYFQLTPSELAQSLQILSSRSSEISDYNLAYSYDDELNEAPENRGDMLAYSEVLLARSRVELEKPESDRDSLLIAKNLGMAGSLQKIAGQLEDAERLLQDSLTVVSKQNISRAVYVQQSIRLYDVWKRMCRYENAISGLIGIVNICKNEPSLQSFLDFALQHLGKAQYAAKDYKAALNSFQQALDLRLQKNEPDLIQSSQRAFDSCRQKLERRS